MSLSRFHRSLLGTSVVLVLAICEDGDGITSINVYIRELPAWEESTPQPEAGTERSEVDADSCTQDSVDAGLCV